MWLFKKNNKNVHLKNEPQESTLSDYDDTYIYVKRVLYLLGLRLMRDDSPAVRLFWNIVYWIEFVLVLGPIILDGVKINIILSGGHFEETNLIFRILPCVGYLSLALLKTYKVVYQRSVFENLTDELRSMWPQGVLSDEEQTVLSKALKEINFFVKAFYYCNYVVAVSIVVPPYVEMIKRALGHEIPRILPFDYYIPFDGTQPVIFEFMVTLQVLQTMITLWGVSAGDLLFCVLVSHITTQFDLLCVRIKKIFYVTMDNQLIPEFPLAKYEKKSLKEDTEQSLTAFELNARHKFELKEIVIRHKALIRLANDVEDLFSFAFLVNFICSSIIICFCGYCSVLVEKWNEFMYKTFLVSALSQTWLLCWYGEKLFVSSGKVADALYNSGWYTASQEIKKIILIMIFRSHKNSHITTYGFSVICLTSYTTIIKTSWSYFTLLLNMNKEMK